MLKQIISKILRTLPFILSFARSLIQLGIPNVTILIKYIAKNKQFILYGIIGISGATLDFTIFNFLLKFDFYYLIANSISILFGITNNFILNAKFNFKKTDNYIKRYINFLFVGLFGLFVSNLFLYIFIGYLEWSAIYSKLLTIIIIFIIQYNLNKSLTFR